MTLSLTVGCAITPRLQPLMDGTVKPQNMTLGFVTMGPGDLFFRNLNFDEFDVSEMSMSTYLMCKDRSDGKKWDWTALPVFTSKAFAWLDLYVNTASGIKHPRDIKGKRIGVPDYTVTAALWMREMLRELYDIQPKDNIWYQGRLKELSVGALLGLDQYVPAGATLKWLGKDQTIDTMLDQGELDVAYGLSSQSSHMQGTLGISRHGGITVQGNPRIRELLNDGGRGLVIEYFKKMGFIPRNHFVFIQNRVLREHPWAPLELYNAFQQAKEVAYQRAREACGTYLLFEGNDFQEQAATFGPDPFPYGIKASQKMLETLFHASFEQGLIRKLPKLEEIFCPSTLET